ncbi:MAG: tetraacyldisaccharide 4'-kinase [Planctomycetota bacterium]
MQVMDQREIRDILSGRRRGVFPSLLRAVLLPVGCAYSLAMRLRRAMYRRGVFKVAQTDVPVISVGNITTGGTGKTPMVAWVVERLKDLGASPAILIRGYKGSGGTSDEAELLAGLTGVAVIADPDRVTAAARAMGEGADVLVMDDAFQHLRLARDLDIVLVDAANPFGYDHCLPRGLLRESPGVLKDADAIVITRCDTVDDDALEELRNRLIRLAPAARIHLAVHKPVCLVTHAGEEIPLDAIADRKVFAFCGIGNPESFFTSLVKLGARVAGERAFDDHVVYTSDVLDRLRCDITESRADLVVTTQKDAVKFTGAELGVDIRALAIEMAFIEGEKELIGKLRATLNAGKSG